MIEFPIPKTWNDVLAASFGGTILAVWILSGLGLMVLQDIVFGATISIMTLIVQYYFRRKPPEKSSAS